MKFEIDVPSLAVDILFANIRDVFEKKQDYANNYFITNENSKLQHVPIKLVSSSPDALLHSPPPCFHSLLGGFFWDRSELLRYGSFNGC